MHFYAHNIGDYRKDTLHLSLLEHGIYRQLLDSYYLHEMPLCGDIAKLMRSHSVRSADEKRCFQNVLNDFFELTEEGYVHKRCDEVIAAYHGKSEKARESANARWQREESKKNANALQTQSEGNANHKQITINQEPITKSKKKATIVACPPDVSEQVWGDWMQHRKLKKASVTETVIKEARKEAALAGMTLEQFFSVWCVRGSIGLKASWLKDNNDKPTAGDRNREVLSGLTRGLVGGGKNVGLLGK